MNVGDFLEFERAFHGNRIMASPTKEQCILLHRKVSGPFADLWLEFEDFGKRNGQMTQGLQFRCLKLLRQTAA